MLLGPAFTPIRMFMGPAFYTSALLSKTGQFGENCIGRPLWSLCGSINIFSTVRTRFEAFQSSPRHPECPKTSPQLPRESSRWSF